MVRRHKFTSTGAMVHHLPESRQRRMARLRTAALAAIAAVAATGVAVQELRQPVQPPGMDVAEGPRPFDLFPG